MGFANVIKLICYCYATAPLRYLVLRINLVRDIKQERKKKKVWKD